MAGMRRNNSSKLGNKRLERIAQREFNRIDKRVKSREALRSLFVAAYVAGYTEGSRECVTKKKRN